MPPESTNAASGEGVEVRQINLFDHLNQSEKV